ncbi:MAG: S8 family serine peptidase [bacterium]|nr:S8 family serine peptidase [bacterium]
MWIRDWAGIGLIGIWLIGIGLIGIGLIGIAVGVGLATPAAAQSGEPDSFAKSSGSWGQPGRDQWALSEIGWSPQVGGSRVIVAVLDTGIDWLHPDLPRGSIWRNEAERNNGIDDDGNGYIDDRIGWNFIEDRPEPWDDVGHGTHVAGLIAAGTGNGVGIAGVSSTAQILPLKVLGASGKGRASQIVAALDYATARGARVINLSVGGQGLTEPERQAIERATAAGSVVIIAAGNTGGIAALGGVGGRPGVLVVAATGRDGARTPFSSFGSEVGLAAPGVDIVSLRAHGSDFLRVSGGSADAGSAWVGADRAYLRASGTSFSAALVSGVAARILAADPSLRPEQVVRMLQQSARDVLPEGVDPLTGYGNLDSAAALAADPEHYVEARLVRIELTPGGQLLRVVGTARADDFGEASLTFTPVIPSGEEEDDEAPAPITLGLASAVRNGILARIERGALAGAPEWQIQLEVKHADGRGRRAGLAFVTGIAEAKRSVAPPAFAGLAAPTAAAALLWLPARPQFAMNDGAADEITLSRSLETQSQVCPEGQECAEDPCRTYRQDVPVVAGAGLAGPSQLVLRGKLTDGASALADKPVRLIPKAPLLGAFLGEAAPTLAEGSTAPGALACAPPGFDTPFSDGVKTDASGSFSLAASGANAGDRGCWDVVADAECHPERTPLHELAPELEPGRISVLVPSDAAGAGAALASLAGLAWIDARPLASIDRTLLRFSAPAGGAAIAVALAALSADSRVDLAQQERRYHTAAAYSDPLGAFSYGPAQIGAERMHSAATGKGVRVAVIDSGVDAGHEELAGRVVASHDTTGYGPSADRHGTAVAGLIAAQPGNGMGAWGAAPGAEILSIKACQPAGQNELDARCWSASVAAAIDLALEEGARVVNLSIAGPSDPLVERVIGAALAKGAIVVAASGNGGAHAEPSYPGAIEGVLAVTAIDADGRLFRQATRGDFVDVAAPGVEVIAPAPDGYPALSGTSFATAFVSSAAALLLEPDPDPTAASIREALMSTGTDLGDPGRDPLYGAGGIDLCAAAETLRAGSAVCP